MVSTSAKLADSEENLSLSEDCVIPDDQTELREEKSTTVVSLHFN